MWCGMPGSGQVFCKASGKAKVVFQGRMDLVPEAEEMSLFTLWTAFWKF